MRITSRYLCTVMLLSSLMVMMQGCGSQVSEFPSEEGSDYFTMDLLENSRDIVSYPSGAGAIVGATAGLPAALALYPITMPLTLLTESSDLTIVPLQFFTEAGAVIVGGPFWLLFGH